MNLNPITPNANEYPSEDPFNPLRIATLQVGWIVKATQLLAELGCAAAALAFYLLQEFYGNIPAYLEYLPFFLYLAQGLFFVWKGWSWVAEWSNHKKPWWQLVIAVLGWPMHHTLMTFHQKVHQFDDQHPAHQMTMPWLRKNLASSLLRAFGAWFFGVYSAIIILVVLDQGLGLF